MTNLLVAHNPTENKLEKFMMTGNLNDLLEFPAEPHRRFEPQFCLMCKRDITEERCKCLSGNNKGLKNFYSSRDDICWDCFSKSKEKDIYEKYIKVKRDLTKTI